ncbi:hypothetical protein PABG_01443 [Paracoccidioides brasiliensis Pb03]|nr:hypothetical protein PABG_01443 [Paracoccidioides brasiliensis Pb03]
MTWFYGTTVNQGKGDEDRSWAKVDRLFNGSGFRFLIRCHCYSAQNCQANPPGGPSQMIGGGEEVAVVVVVEDHDH